MRPRTLGRRLAMQYLFMADLNHFSDLPDPDVFFRLQRLSTKDADSDEGDDGRQEEAENMARALVSRILDSLDSIDRRLADAADNWSVSRMGAVERNVIRVACAELDLAETPARVILDEAVEMAKRFGDAESGKFVNGVLDRIAMGARRPGSRRKEGK